MSIQILRMEKENKILSLYLYCWSSFEPFAKIPLSGNHWGHYSIDRILYISEMKVLLFLLIKPLSPWSNAAVYDMCCAHRVFSFRENSKRSHINLPITHHNILCASCGQQFVPCATVNRINSPRLEADADEDARRNPKAIRSHDIVNNRLIRRHWTHGEKNKKKNKYNNEIKEKRYYLI